MKKKNELSNKRNDELEIQLIQYKRIIKKDENNSVSQHEDFKQLENYENVLKSKYDNFESEYNEIISSNNYKEFKTNRKLKADKKLLMMWLVFIYLIF
ncbi:Protein of unknown function (DUF2031), putative [Plasmodium chabaudi adami]|uniref:Uncharacterized protein n=1 Tax=Plasmodium chabaudi adami TaxID=5826 RepID=A0A1D3LB53_PLACE|nr:Protein of unknown function (DUF2031), putative [Plasmodium chabaudi adami]